MKKFLLFLLWPLILTAATEEVQIFSSPPFPKKLSQWNLFLKDNQNRLTLNKGVHPFDLATPLFSDYALKFRTIFIPKDQKIKYQESLDLLFPVGTIFTKTFFYPKEALEIPGASVDIHHPDHQIELSSQLSPLQGKHLIETRILVHTEGGWVGLPYVWDDQQTEAELKITGVRRQIKIISTPNFNHGDQQFTYSVPNMNQCKACHLQQEGFSRTVKPLGPKVKNLNHSYPYPSPRGSINQLEYWRQVGMLEEHFPSHQNLPRAPQWENPQDGTVENRARTYLEINCAHCHNPQGIASTSGLFLGTEIAHGPQLGLCKSPVAAGNAGGGLPYDIFPGKPEKSLLAFRIKSNQPAIMMPELGRALVHTEGVKLIEDWIHQLPGTCPDL